MAEWVKLIIFSFVAVVYLFFVSKILGKKQIAQLEFIDYVMGISIGSIAAEMATDTGETPFYFYLIAMTVFFLVDLAITFVGRKGPALKHFFKGRPITVIYDGKFDYENLKVSKLDVNDVLALCREQGYFDITQVAYAVFETSGKLSVLPKSPYKQVTAEDMGVKLPPASLPCILVVDGNISYSGLNEINKTVEWLKAKTDLDDKTMKNVLLATYDNESDEVNVQLKEE